jgi:hypothetical protein
MARALLPISFMMRVALVVCLSGCTFVPGGTAGDSGQPGVDGGTIATHRPCDMSDPALRICLDFDDTPLGFDASANGHDAAIANVTTVARAGELAATVGANSSITVAASHALDFAGTLSIDLWIDPAASTSPPPTRTLVDDPGQYTFELRADGKLHCAIGRLAVDSHPIDTGAWTHAACSYDGSTLRVFVAGDVDACAGGHVAVAASTPSALTIASAFVGAIDNVHVLARPASASEMCTLAGRTGCQSSCPRPGPD